mmetsp:Transcript_11309/g.36123  ORF Transcript_11309/g.36123 Transcript_11309/m.36123 type:complete len:242 (-) Transcript_11309:31-756(-)
MDLNFSCPAVSQIMRVAACGPTEKRRKVVSTPTVGRVETSSRSCPMRRKSTDDLPTPEDPRRTHFTPRDMAGTDSSSRATAFADGVGDSTPAWRCTAAWSVNREDDMLGASRSGTGRSSGVPSSSRWADPKRTPCTSLSVEIIRSRGCTNRCPISSKYNTSPFRSSDTDCSGLPVDMYRADAWSACLPSALAALLTHASSLSVVRSATRTPGPADPFGTTVTRTCRTLADGSASISPLAGL